LANERIGILPWEVNKLFGIDVSTAGEKLVIRQPITFQNKAYFNLHKLLRAIDCNVVGTKLLAEAVCSDQECLMQPSKLLEAFKQYPSIVTNTYRLMDACNVTMDFHTDKNKKTFSHSKEDDRNLLEKLAMDGLAYRYGKNKEARA